MAQPAPQILIAFQDGPRVAGLPPAVRCACAAAADLPGCRVLISGLSEAAARPWRRQLAAAGAVFGDASALRAALDPRAPVFELPGDGFPAPGALARWDGRGLPDGWVAAASREQAAAAEKALFASLPKDTDGYIAQLDRRWSMALSKALLPLPVTPNDTTTASLALGLLGAWWLASGSYGWTIAGALLLWFCCLLDGCDGEVARLKLLCSPAGAAYDLWADHVAHFATFVAIPIGVHRAAPHASFRAAGLLLVSGFLACVFSVWKLVLSKPEAERGPYALLIERVASRDYVYLIAAFALLGRLDWFLYAAGVGSHVFWVALWLLPAAATPSPKRAASPLPLPR